MLELTDKVVESIAKEVAERVAYMVAEDPKRIRLVVQSGDGLLESDFEANLAEAEEMLAELARCSSSPPWSPCIGSSGCWNQKPLR